MTLFENLLQVAGVQGGTVHQYIDVMDEYYPAFKKEWDRHVSNGDMPMTKTDFVRIAYLSNYEGLIWRPRKVEEKRLSTFTADALRDYFDARQGI